MSTAKRIRVQRYDWFDKVALWRAAAPRNRAAVEHVNTRYYFGIQRFVHCIEARTLSQMERSTVQVYSAT